MTQKLQGKVAVITGGTSGIGLETAILLKQEGARVAVFGNTEEHTANAVKRIGEDTLGFTGNIQSKKDLAEFFVQVSKKFGRVDFLFVNAGISKSVPLADITEENYDEMFNINVKGSFFTIQAALPLMNRGSSIVVTTSNVIHVGYPNLSLYSASKSSLRGLVKSLSAEFLEKGIRVNCVSPGPIETTLLTKGLDAKTHSQVMDTISAGIPMKRMGKVSEIAKAVLFLASDDSSFTTGTELIVDGGGANIGRF